GAIVAAVAPAACDSGTGETGDAGVPTGDPATGPGGGRNLACGGASFSPEATMYQDITAAVLDPESHAILAALDASGWGDASDRTTLGIDFSFEVNCAAIDV